MKKIKQAEGIDSNKVVQSFRQNLKEDLLDEMEFSGNLNDSIKTCQILGRDYYTKEDLEFGRFEEQQEGEFRGESEEPDYNPLSARNIKAQNGFHSNCQKFWGGERLNVCNIIKRSLLSLCGKRQLESKNRSEKSLR